MFVCTIEHVNLGLSRFHFYAVLCATRCCTGLFIHTVHQLLRASSTPAGVVMQLTVVCDFIFWLVSSHCWYVCSLGMLFVLMPPLYECASRSLLQWDSFIKWWRIGSFQSDQPRIRWTKPWTSGRVSACPEETLGWFKWDKAWPWPPLGIVDYGSEWYHFGYRLPNIPPTHCRFEATKNRKSTLREQNYNILEYIFIKAHIRIYPH